MDPDLQRRIDEINRENRLAQAGHHLPPATGHAPRKRTKSKRAECALRVPHAAAGGSAGGATSGGHRSVESINKHNRERGGGTGANQALIMSMGEINRQNRERKADGSDLPFGTKVAPGGEYIPFGETRVPWMPYAFTHTCCMCGKTGIFPDRRRLLPLPFLRVFLEESCCKTPFVYNILYQMTASPELEVEEARRWQLAWRRVVPSHLRGRVAVCAQCFRMVKERACPRACLSVEGSGAADAPVDGAADDGAGAKAGDGAEAKADDGGEGGDDAPPPGGGEWWGGVGTGYADLFLRDVRPTEDAFRESMDPASDDWIMHYGSRFVPPSEGGTNAYMQEPGRKSRRPLKMMLPVDLVFHMVHSPSTKRVPEYRMFSRVLNVMLCPRGGYPQKGVQCIYTCFPSLQMDMLLMHIHHGLISLKGTPSGGGGTIADRIHMSAYVSGGKRRVSRANSHLGCVIRRCRSLLTPLQGVEEGGGGFFGGMDVDDDEPCGEEGL